MLDTSWLTWANKIHAVSRLSIRHGPFQGVLVTNLVTLRIKPVPAYHFDTNAGGGQSTLR